MAHQNALTIANANTLHSYTHAQTHTYKHERAHCIMHCCIHLCVAHAVMPRVARYAALRGVILPYLTALTLEPKFHKLKILGSDPVKKYVRHSCLILMGIQPSQCVCVCAYACTYAFACVHMRAHACLCVCMWVGALVPAHVFVHQ